MYWSLYIALFLENRFLRQHYQVKRSMSFCLDIPGLSPKKLQQFSLPTMYASMFTQTLTSTQYYLLFKIFPIKSQHLSIYLPAIWNFSSVSYMFKSFALPHPPPPPPTSPFQGYSTFIYHGVANILSCSTVSGLCCQFWFLQLVSFC